MSFKVAASKAIAITAISIDKHEQRLKDEKSREQIRTLVRSDIPGWQKAVGVIATALSAGVRAYEGDKRRQNIRDSFGL